MDRFIDLDVFVPLQLQIETLLLAFDALCNNASLQLQNGADFCSACFDGILVFFLLKAVKLLQGKRLKMAEGTNQPLSPSSTVTPSSSSSSSSISSAPRSAPPADDSQQAADNDENCFENRFSFMMETVRKLQLDGLRDSLLSATQLINPSSASPSPPPPPPSASYLHKPPMAPLPSPHRTPLASFRDNINHLPIPLPLPPHSLPTDKTSNLKTASSPAEVGAVFSSGGVRPFVVTPDSPHPLAFTRRDASFGGNDDDAAGFCGATTSTPKSPASTPLSPVREDKGENKKRVKRNEAGRKCSFFHLRYQSASTDGSVSLDGESPTSTFMYQDGSIVQRHDVCNCPSHAHTIPSPPNFSYGPIPLLCKEEYLFDRLGLSEVEDVNTVYSVFMKSFKGYDILPRSNKVIVLDTKLPVKKAFFALAYNSLRASTLWDSHSQRFVGMLTLTDFIRLLVTHHEEGLRHGNTNIRLTQLEDQSIEDWRRTLGLDTRPLFFVNAEASLFDALKLLIENKVHRLPLIESDGGNLMHIITHKRILRFLFLYIYELPRPSFMFESIESLGIGTFKNIAKLKADMLLLDALYLFLERRVSALPVVSENGKLVDLYSRFDVLHLCRERIYQNLERITIQEAIDARPGIFEDVVTCRSTESLAVIAERLARYQIHRLVVIDENRHVKGMISLSDVLVFMVLSPRELEVEID